MGVITWPYKSSTDNNFAFLVSWVLVVVAALTSPELYLFVDPGRGPSVTLVAAILLLGLTLIVVERVAWKRKTTVDAVAAKALARCKVWWSKMTQWVAARLPCTTSEEENATVGRTRKGVFTTTSNLPRYRESLLGDVSSFSDSTGTQSEGQTKRFKGWKKHLRFKTEEYEVPLSPSILSPAASSMSSTVIGVEEEGRYLDSGLASSATGNTSTHPSTTEHTDSV